MKFFKTFPIQDIIKPEIGINVITKIVSSILIENIIRIVNIIVNGSLISSSRIERNEF